MTGEPELSDEGRDDTDCNPSIRNVQQAELSAEVINDVGSDNGFTDTNISHPEIDAAAQQINLTSTGQTTATGDTQSSSQPVDGNSVTIISFPDRHKMTEEGNRVRQILVQIICHARKLTDILNIKATNTKCEPIKPNAFTKDDKYKFLRNGIT